MSTENKPSSRAGSKTNLNESNVPLLLVEEENRVIHKNPEGGDTKPSNSGSAETFELKKKGEEETEFRNGDTNAAKKAVRGKSAERQSSTMLDEMTVGLNLLDRDDRKINEPVNLAFGDVIAEPEANQGLEGPWKWSYAAFTFVKTWMYSILAAIVGVPLAIVWGLVFSLITFAMVWLITPLLRVIDVAFGVIRRLVVTITSTFIEPFFAAIGALMSQIRIRRYEASASGQQRGDEEERRRIRETV